MLTAKHTHVIFVRKFVETYPLPGSTWSPGTSLTMMVIIALFVTSFVKLRMRWLVTRLSAADHSSTKCDQDINEI